MKKLSEKKRMILRFVLIAVISIVIGASLYTINAVSLLGNALPMPFGVGFGIVISGGMEPDLKIGDFILVVERDEYQVGDWIVFQQQGMVIVHEVISVDGDTLVTQGTANDHNDDPIALKDVKGKVVFYSTWLGGVVSFLKSPIGVLLVLAIAGLLLYKSYKVEHAQTDEEQKKIEQIKAEIQKIKNQSATNAEDDGDDDYQTAK